MEQIIAKLEERQKELDFYHQYEEEKLELAFLTDFFNSFNLNNPIDIAKIDRKDFILAYLCTLEEKEDFSKLKEKIEKFDNINNITDFTLLKNIFDNLLDEENKDIIIKKRPDNKDEENNENYDDTQNRKERAKDEKIYNESAKLSKLLSKTSEGQDIFFELIEAYPTQLAVAIIKVIKLISICEDIAFEDEETRQSQSFLTFLTDKLGSMYKTINDIKERKEELQRRCVINSKKKNNLDKKLFNLKKKIGELNRKGIITIDPSLLSAINDPEIEQDILIYALKHNLKLYQILENKIEEEKQLSELERLFNNSHFNFSFLKQNEIDYLTKYGQIDKIAKIFEILNDDCFHFLNNQNFPISEILIFSDPSIVSNIRKLYLQGFLSNKIILNNPEIFISANSQVLEIPDSLKDAKYDTLVLNVDILRGYKIDVKSISKTNSKALLEPSNILKENLEIFEPYNLNFSKGRRLNLLSHKEYVKYLDLFIELGLSDYIRENPDLLNDRSNILINRIHICKCLGINYFSDGKLSSIVTSEDFKIMNMTINDEELLSDYIENSTHIYENGDIAKMFDEGKEETTPQVSDPLKDYKIDDNTYNINGVLISRNKFLRNYSLLQRTDFEEEDKVFNSLIHGSILDLNALDTLESIVKKNHFKKNLKPSI